MDLTGKILTTEMFWWSTLVVGLIDFTLVFLLARRLTPARFLELRWPLLAGMLVVWVPIWMVLFPSFWDSVYRLVMPPWARWGYQLFAVLFPVLGLGFWWLALRIPGNPVVNYCLLGGLLGFLTHLRAMYAARMHEKVPLLRGVSPMAMIVFSFFEFVAYWVVALLLALALKRLWDRRRYAS
jgi:hypothetical protein